MQSEEHSVTTVVCLLKMGNLYLTMRTQTNLYQLAIAVSKVTLKRCGLKQYSLSFTVSVGQEFGSSLDGWLWLRLCPEVAGESTSMVPSPHGWQVCLAANKILELISMRASLQGHLSVLMMQCLASPRASNARDQGRSCNIFYDLASRHIPSLWQQSTGHMGHPDSEWEGTTQGREYQEVRTWLPQTPIKGQKLLTCNLQNH